MFLRFESCQSLRNISLIREMPNTRENLTCGSIILEKLFHHILVLCYGQTDHKKDYSLVYVTHVYVFSSWFLYYFVWKKAAASGKNLQVL